MPQIDIEQAWIDTYEANIRFALQQNDSKLSDKVTFGTVEGEKKRFTFIGTAAMTERTTKYGKTEFQDISFYNRWIGRRVFDTAFIIDPFEDVEKALTDLGDKLSADEKAGVQAEIDKVKEALKGTDTEMIKMATDGLSKKFSDLAGKIYQQQAPQGDPNMGGQPGAGAQSGPQGDFVDADFTEVKDDDQNK